MPGPRRALPLPLAGVIGAATALVACAQLLNLDGLDFVAPEPDAAPPPAPPVCESGEARCEGVALQVCRRDQTGFRTARVCSSEALCCDEAACGGVACLPPVCMPGDFRCDGPELAICDDAQAGWTPIDSCASPAQCNAKLGRCTEQPCNATLPDYQCNGPVLETCAVGGWQTRDECEATGLCNDTATAACADSGCTSDGVLQPSSCEAGDYLRCNDAQTGFEIVETCLNATRCYALLDRIIDDPHVAQLDPGDLARLGCVEQACLPGKYQCDTSGRLLRCNPNRSAYQFVAQCNSAGQCDAELGLCQAEPCTDGRRQCSGNQLQLCQNNAWQPLRDCTLREPCDAAFPDGCRPGVCEPMEYRCDETALQRCSASGTGWIPVRQCETAALCNAAARRCDEPACGTEQRRCNRQGQLQQCSPGREAWVLEQDCPALATPPVEASAALVTGLCDSTNRGRLAQPGCAEGQLRCNSEFLERCRGNAWRPELRCESAALCDPLTLTCLPPVCVPGTFQCLRRGTNEPADADDSTLGLVLQVCAPGGNAFVTTQECSSEQLCDAAHGQCDICVSNQAVCVDDTLYQCSADGQERTLGRECPLGCVSGSLPDAGTAVTGPAACRDDPAP
jgi:hypothetical protein